MFPSCCRLFAFITLILIRAGFGWDPTPVCNLTSSRRIRHGLDINHWSCWFFDLAQMMARPLLEENWATKKCTVAQALEPVKPPQPSSGWSSCYMKDHVVNHMWAESSMFHDYFLLAIQDLSLALWLQSPAGESEAHETHSAVWHRKKTTWVGVGRIRSWPHGGVHSS